MARVTTRSGLRLLQAVLAVLVVVGIVLAVGGAVNRELPSLLEGASLALVALICILLAQVRFARRRRLPPRGG